MSKRREKSTSEVAEQQIGPKLKQLRKSAGLSLRSLAELVGFSASFVSQVENGLASPSIASLGKMTSALGVTLSDVFATRSTTETVVIRARSRPSFRSLWSRARVQLLIAPGGCRTLEAFLVTLEPEGVSGKHPATVSFDQFAMVVDGRITLTHAGEVIELGQGDSVVIRAKTPHRWRNPGHNSAQMLIVSSRIL
jgi:transcriptional regulator with XRE-family HTH domain